MEAGGARVSGRANNKGGDAADRRRTDASREQHAKDEAVTRDPDIRGAGKGARDERSTRDRRG